MALLDRTLDLTKINPYQKIGIYGAEGVGKTYFSAFAPDPIFIDLENSTDTLKALIRDKVLPGGSVFVPENWKEVQDVVKEIIASKKYKTIVIDTVTRLQKFQMNNYVRAQKTVLEGKRDEFTRYQADYLYSNNLLDSWLMDLMRLPINVILNAHVVHDIKIDKDTGSSTVLKTRPNLPPKLSGSMSELFSFIGYLEVKTDIGGRIERSMRVNPTGIIVAKNRQNIQEMKIPNPTYKGIFEK